MKVIANALSGWLPPHRPSCLTAPARIEGWGQEIEAFQGGLFFSYVESSGAERISARGNQRNWEANLAAAGLEDKCRHEHAAGWLRVWTDLGRAPRTIDALRAHPLGRRAQIVGTCIEDRIGSVIVETGVGRRFLQEPDGEPLPRIC